MVTPPWIRPRLFRHDFGWVSLPWFGLKNGGASHEIHHSLVVTWTTKQMRCSMDEDQNRKEKESLTSSSSRTNARTSCSFIAVDGNELVNFYAALNRRKPNRINEQVSQQKTHLAPPSGTEVSVCIAMPSSAESPPHCKSFSAVWPMPSVMPKVMVAFSTFPANGMYPRTWVRRLSRTFQSDKKKKR